MLAKYYLEHLKKVKDALLEQEAENIAMTERQHDVIASLVRFHDELVGMPERLMVKGGTPLFAVTDLEEAGLFPGADLAEKYNVFEALRPLSIRQSTVDYEAARSQLHIAIEEYVGRIDRNYGTNYVVALNYGELQEETTTLDGQRDALLQQFNSQRANSPLSNEELDYLIELAMARYDLHIHGDQYLTRDFSDNPTYTTLSGLMNWQRITELGLADGSLMYEGFSTLNEKRELVNEQRDRGTVSPEALDAYLDAKGDLLLSMEIYLYEAEKKA